MSHKRKAIRHALRDALDQHPQLTGRVFTTRARPTEQKELPVIIVYGLDEESERTSYQGSLQRNLAVAVEIRASAVGALDDALDDLCSVVESVVADSRRLSGLAMDTVLTTTSIGIDGEGEARQALATLRYNVRYQTDAAGN